MGESQNSDPAGGSLLYVPTAGLLFCDIPGIFILFDMEMGKE
jgi:hypothetical protein